MKLFGCKYTQLFGFAIYFLNFFGILSNEFIVFKILKTFVRLKSLSVLLI